MRERWPLDCSIRHPISNRTTYHPLFCRDCQPIRNHPQIVQGRVIVFSNILYDRCTAKKVEVTVSPPYTVGRHPNAEKPPPVSQYRGRDDPITIGWYLFVQFGR